MGTIAVVQTSIPDSREAGEHLGRQIIHELGNQSPDALIIFASPQHDYPILLESLRSMCSPALMLGCSSAGEFTSETRGVGEICALALRSPDMQFSMGQATGLRGDCSGAASQIVSAFRGMSNHHFTHRTALVLVDGLAGHADDLLDYMTRLTGGTYQFVGGGAGDDDRFQHTHVFAGTEVLSDAAVALEILSHEPIGIGVAHGWKPATSPMRVTESDGMRLISLNAIPVLDVFQQHAEETGQTFDHGDPVPFFLHNVIGIATTDGYKLRVPLAIEPDGAILCAADVPNGATAYLMRAGDAETIDAASSATKAALEQIQPKQPGAVIFFDCVATRLRMGDEFGFELDAVANLLGTSRYLGCNTYGQIARAEGQLSGFHNCTAVACAIPA